MNYQIGICIFCYDVIRFLSGLVPTFSDENCSGPVCKKCVEEVNLIREEYGEQTISIPEGTYEEVIPC